MSNANRPRTGLKACPFDGATDRDSNGQCHCRNVLYREVKKAPQQKAKIQKAYDGMLKDGESIAAALEAARTAVPALARPTKKAAVPAKKASKKTASKQAKKAQAKAEKIIAEEFAKVEEKQAEAAKATADKPRYLLQVDGWEETSYARKDAAIKNGVRSGKPWTVVYKGKNVATSDDLL